MDDSQLIKKLGGPAKLARRLGYGKGGTQRVQNWIARGIPASVKVKHPALFMGSLVTRGIELQPTAHQETSRV